MGDITLEPIPQETDNCLSFDPLGSRHVHQRSVGELTLEPTAIQRVQQEQLQSMRVRIKESEAKWQEDLSRWKIRRRSTNSELHRKQEEREQTELTNSGGGEGAIRTTPLSGVPEESSHKTASSHVLSNTTILHSQTLALGEKTHLNCQTYIPVAGAPSSSSNMPGPMSDAGPTVRSGWSTNSACPLTTGATSVLTGRTGVETTDSTQTCTGQLFNPPAAAAPDQSSPTSDPEPYKKQRPDFSRRASFLESFYAGGTRISATLPRGFRRSEGCSRLSMGVTPRPFGAKPSNVSSLPRVYAMDDSHKSMINGQRDHSLIPSFLSSQGKVTTSADKGHSRSSTHPISIKKEEDREERRDGRSSAPLVQSFVSKVTVGTSAKQPSSPVLISEIGEVKVGQSEMRVCLNQKPNSGRDLGFKAHWDSTGACVKFVQAGSPAELCGLQMGDEILALSGCRVADMNYEQFKGSMDTAQQNGTLLMDIRRHGQNGRPEHIFSISPSSNSPVESAGKMQVNANGVLSKMVNGNVQNKSVAVQNKGGSESAISDLQVPSISTTSSRWSWDHDEERRRQEKWQMEQERLLQEKYRQDQEKLEEEWRRAQQDVYGNEVWGPEEQKSPDVLSNGNAVPYFPPPFFNQSNAPISVTPNQIADEVEVAQNRQGALQIAARHHAQKAQVECDSTTKSQWTKSKSTPAFEDLYKQDAKGSSKIKGHVSQAEQERLQILEEMRKKTQLLTDSSWIRQRTTNINKEPVDLGTSIRRYESLCNLHTSVHSSRQPYISSRPHSALGSTGSYRSGRSSLGPGSAIFSSGLKQSSWFASNSSTPPVTASSEPHPNSQQRDSVSAAGLALGRVQSPELRSESDTDSSSVTAAKVDLESIPPSPSGQNALKQIEEECTTETAQGIAN